MFSLTTCQQQALERDFLLFLGIFYTSICGKNKHKGYRSAFWLLNWWYFGSKLVFQSHPPRACLPNEGRGADQGLTRAHVRTVKKPFQVGSTTCCSTPATAREVAVAVTCVFSLLACPLRLFIWKLRCLSEARSQPTSSSRVVFSESCHNSRHYPSMDLIN